MSETSANKPYWFDVLIEQHSDGMMVFESVRDESGSIQDFRWLYANQSAAAIVGKPRHWFRGRLLLQEMPENRDSGLFDTYVKVVETGQPSALEFTYPINGEQRFFRNHSTRINDGFAVSFSDETEKQWLEQALKEDQDRLLTALDAAQASAFDWNLLTDEVTWHTGGYRILGLPANENPVSLSAWLTHVHPDDREMLTDSVRQAIRDTDRLTIEYRVVLSDGTERWLLAVGSVRTKDGQATRMLGTISDVTSRKQAELEKRENEELFRIFANAIPQLAWVANASGYPSWFNQRWYAFTGTASDRGSANSWLDRVAPGELDAVTSQWQRAILSAEEVEITHQIRNADGDYKPFLTRARPVLNESGMLTRWVGTSTEISDLRETQKTLEDADREKDKFLATLAHELRNPLAPISNAIELLDSQGSGLAGVRQTTAMLKRQVKQMVRLVDDLLDINRIKFGRISLRHQPIDLASVINEALENTGPVADQLGHSLKVTIAEHLPDLVGDHLRLVQALSNLLNNACKFMAPGGLIELDVKPDKHEIRLSVQDYGVGLKSADIDRIFDMFAQAGDSNIPRDGLGIGLALSKSLIELHGGKLTVSSPGIGHGSRFLISLPTSDAGAHAPRNAPQHHSPVASRQHSSAQSILIVDDNFDAAESLAWILEADGHLVQLAGAGQEALQVIDQHDINVVILDIGLPDISGYEVARAIRSRQDADRYQLIALTGWGQPDDREQSAQAGFDAHLVKPADLATLRQLIQNR